MKTISNNNYFLGNSRKLADCKANNLINSFPGIVNNY